MRKNGEHRTLAIGAPSVIMIFVVLCLTCFACLSMVSANADMRLASRAAENTHAWYQADAKAQGKLCELYALVSAGEATDEAITALGFTKDGEDENTATLYTKITDYTALKTSVVISGNDFALKENSTVVTGELEYTEIPFIWDGETLDD